MIFGSIGAYVGAKVRRLIANATPRVEILLAEYGLECRFNYSGIAWLFARVFPFSFVTLTCSAVLALRALAWLGLAWLF